MKNIVYEDLYSFNMLSNILYSPDGNHALFIKANAQKESNGYKSEIWLIDSKTCEYKRITHGGEDKGAVWLDNETILFSSKKENKQKGRYSQYYKISIKGGEAELCFSISQKVNKATPMGKDKFMLEIAHNCENDKEKEKSSDVLVFDEIYFWFNNLGIRNKVRNSIVIYDKKDNSQKQITSKYFSGSEAVISPNGEKILYCGVTYTDVFPREKGIYLYDVKTDKTEILVEEGKFEASSLQFLGEDKVFFALNPMEFSGQNSYFYIMDLKSKDMQKFPYADCEIGGSVGCDCNYGGGQVKLYYNKSLYATRSVWGNSYIYKMDMKGNWQQITTVKGSVMNFDIKNDLIFMTAMRNTDLSEIYSFDLKTRQEKRITFFNKEYIESHNVITPEYFVFKNSDGIDLDGYLLKPLNYQKGKKYPAVYEMHGGPKGIFGSVFHHEMQVLSNKGYFVFYTNPRGSDGRGSDFAAMTGNLGKNDFRDFMEFFDEVFTRYPDIDSKRVGICGGSYGGFMCNWMIGHTDRFAAAASQRSISNYLTKALTTDIGYTYNMAQLDTTPWKDFDTVWETSPLKNAPFAKTPTLFIQSNEDYRCWMGDALQMFSALKMNGVDSRIALFKGENHELSRSGKPQNRISRLREICDWFQKYLKNE